MPVTMVATIVETPMIRAARNENDAAVMPARKAVPKMYFREAGTRGGPSVTTASLVRSPVVDLMRGV